MSAIEKRLIESAKTALAVIGEVAKVGGDNPKAALAIRALEIISTIVQSVADGFDRKTDPADVAAVIEAARVEFETALAANDAEADNALDAKFPTGDDETGEKPPTD